MKILISLFALMVLASGVSACSTKTEDLKSPCVGAEDSPCDKRILPNQYS